VLLGVWFAVGAAATVLAVAAFDSDRARELRRLLEDNVAADGSTTLTDAEVDRALELVGELVWMLLPWGIALTVVYAIVAAWSHALVAQVAAATPDAGLPVGDDDAASMRSALRRVPAVVAAWIALGLIGLAVFAALSLPVVLLVISDAGGAVIGLTAFFSVIAAVAISVWLWVRLGVTIASAALGRHGLGIGRSWALTHGHVGFAFGRLLVAALIGAAVGGATNVVTNVGGFLGVGVGVALLLMLGAIVEAFRTIVSVSAQVVIIAQIEELEAIEGNDQPERTGGATGSFVPGGHT
jgi:hypothetical protein